jgi:hypothetical protein
MMLDAERVELLIQLATDYATRCNLMVDHYLQGMFEPLLRDGLSRDLAQTVDTLVRYHQEWLRKS